MKKLLLSGFIIGSFFASVQASSPMTGDEYSFKSERDHWKRHKEGNGHHESSHHDEKSVYANLFSDKDQTIKSGEVVDFGKPEEIDGFACNARNELVVRVDGVYLISFTAVGAQDSSNQDDTEWGLGIAINNSILRGSVAATINSTNISGQVIVSLRNGDKIELKNISKNTILLFSKILGNSNRNASATLVVTKQ